MSKHTPKPWAVGRTLDTPRTRSWTRAEREANDRFESRLVFSGFSPDDQGRGRVLVAECRSPEDARLIAAAPELLAVCEAMASVPNVMVDEQQACHAITSQWVALKAAIAKARGQA